MDTTLLTLAAKLGLSSPAVHRKAEELQRLLAVQGGSRLSLGATTRHVVCLELAATQLGTSLDRRAVVRLSGLSRPKYLTLSQTVGRLLNVAPAVTVHDLCVAHSVTAATQLAHTVLAQYEAKNKSAAAGVDVSLPLYQAAAVLAASKVLKVRVDKQRLFESSRSKRAVYQRVVEAMVTLASQHHTHQAEGGKKRGLAELVEERAQEQPHKHPRTCPAGEEEEEEDKQTTSQADFDAWKKKILEAAAAAAE